MRALNTYYIDAIKNHYLDFSGRATRTQFWLYVLFNLIVFFVLSLVLSFFGKAGDMIYIVCSLAVLLPSIAVAARRLRDGGFSPWWLLICLVPFIGWIVLLVFYLLPSKH
ncbi:MAG: DUF805 domain-containing protein [Elusimicrobiaceae bacterium]|nr:DUF805 domain-containing protein [Elusimicrobiaceae bacterium]